MEDHRVAALEFRELPKNPRLVLELVIRKGSSETDVFSHLLPSSIQIEAGASNVASRFWHIVLRVVIVSFPVVARSIVAPSPSDRTRPSSRGVPSSLVISIT